MKKLLDGIHQFQAGVFGSQRALFQRLAQGQEPDALMITCSDSRIAPNLITQTKPGDLFIIRNAGNLVPAWGVPSGEGATIEYAVDVLGVKDIIICGHTHCGAMKAVAKGGVDELPAVKQWLAHADATRRIMRSRYAGLDGDELVETTAEENVLVQIEHLRTHPSVFTALMKGELTLHAWMYDIAAGAVHAFDPERGQYVPVAEAGQGLAEEQSRLTGRRLI